MNARASFVVLCLLPAALSGGPISAQDGAAGTADEGAVFLLLPVGAKAVSLGRAMTSVEGAEGAFWNPAGLAGLDRSQVVLFRGDQFAGTTTALSTLLSRPGVGTIGASYLLLDVGDQDLTDSSGNLLGTISVRNHLGVISAAANLLDGLSAGVSFKVVQFRLSCRGSQCPDEGTTATTYGFDVGLQAVPVERLRLGAMIAHVGPSLRVLNAEQADPLPARFRLAVAYDVVELLMPPGDFGGWLAVEVQDRLRDPGVPSLYFGAEFTAGQVDALSLRAGYVISDLLGKVQGDDPEDAARVGVGIRYEAFDLSIAKSLAVSTLTGETEPVHVTFSIGF
jgi:hypothetical protein